MDSNLKNLDKSGLRRSSRIVGSKIPAFGLLLVTYLASIQNFQRWPTYGTKESVILQSLHEKDSLLARDIRKRDILKKDENILKSIIEESRNQTNLALFYPTKLCKEEQTTIS